MNDPRIEKILRDAKDDSDGSVIAFLVLLAFFGICGVALWLAHGGRLS